MESSVFERTDTSEADLESSVLSTLDRMGKPVSASGLRSALPRPFQRVPKELTSVLERLVAQRRAFKLGGKTPAYAHRNPDVLAEESLMLLLDRGPASPKEIAARLKRDVPHYAVKAVLERLTRSQRIHAVWKLGKNGKPTKTVETYALGPPAPAPSPPDPRVAVEATILDALAGGSLRTAELKKRTTKQVKGLSVKNFSEVLAQLVHARRVYPHRGLKAGFRTGKPVEYALVPEPPPEPEAFLPEAKRALSAALAKASRFRIPSSKVVALLLESSGVAPEAVWAELDRGPDRVASSQAALDAHASLSDQQVALTKLKELVARERPGALIPIRHLRAAARLDPTRFNAAVLQLERMQAVILHHHDFPGSLSETERAELVLDSYGTYYVGIALGRSS